MSPEELDKMNERLDVLIVEGEEIVQKIREYDAELSQDKDLNIPQDELQAYMKKFSEAFRLGDRYEEIQEEIKSIEAVLKKHVAEKKLIKK